MEDRQGGVLFYMKKGVLYTILGVLAAVVAFIYYYVTLPAINIHSSGFWFFIMAAIVVVIVLYVIRKAGKTWRAQEP